MTNSLKGKNNNLIGYLAVSFLAAIGMAYCFWVSDIFPFGVNSNLFSDLASQYVNFLVFFRNSSWAEKIFSLAKGFGGQTLGLLSYYVFSPFNFITYLFKPEDIEMALFVIFIARAAFMAANMYCYLSSHFENHSLNIAFALMYTFYPFFTKYYYNILWMDCFALLPLVILGTEHIMDKKDGRLFIFSYVYCLISNYYIAYMISLFVLCWFVYRFILVHGFKVRLALKKTMDMAYYAIIGIMLSAPVLIPSFILLTQGKFGDETISSWRMIKSYNILTLPLSFFEGAVVSEYTPHFVSSIVCIFLLLSYVLNRDINKKEKILTLTFFGVMVAGFTFRILGYVWHGFSAPQGFHNRQTFLYAFLMLFICRVAVDKLNWPTGKKALIILAPIYIAFGVYVKIVLEPYINMTNICITVVSVTVVTIAVLLLKRKRELSKRVIAIYVCVISVYMGGFCMARQYNADKPYTIAPAAAEFKADYISVQNTLNKIKDDGFYRIEDLTAWSQNQAMTHGYNSVSHYSSVFEAVQKEMFTYYGYDDTYYSTTYNRTIPLNDFVFGIKYVLSSDSSLVTDHYETISEGDKSIYYNPFWIPVVYTGFVNDVLVGEYCTDTVNNMATALTGIDIYGADGNVDYSKLADIAKIIRANACKVLNNNGMFLSFETISPEHKYMLSSLMYDENWHIKVNGKSVHPQRYMKYYLSVPLETGVVNTIEMTYIPSGLLPGIAAMAAALFVLFLQLTIKKIKNSNKKEKICL